MPVGKQPAQGEALALSALGIKAPLWFLGDIRIAVVFCFLFFCRDKQIENQTTVSPAARSKRTHRRHVGVAGQGAKQVVVLLRGRAVAAAVGGSSPPELPAAAAGPVPAELPEGRAVPCGNSERWRGERPRLPGGGQCRWAPGTCRAPEASEQLLLYINLGFNGSAGKTCPAAGTGAAVCWWVHRWYGSISTRRGSQICKANTRSTYDMSCENSTNIKVMRSSISGCKNVEAYSCFLAILLY